LSLRHFQALLDANKLAEVAASYGMTSEEFSDMLRNDDSARIDQEGRLFYQIPQSQEESMGEDQSSSSTPPFPVEQTFLLHSRPGSNRVIYLDFDGHTTTGTSWNNAYNGGNPIVSPAYSVDADRSQFSTTELSNIQNIWRQVAEDYAPFNVDVTTQDPGQDAITRSSNSDNVYGTRVVITVDDFASCGCGGFAYVGVFNDVGNAYKPAFVFNTGVIGAGEAISHEAGHNLGLHHDGTSSVGYYTGHGSGDTGWAPIMGVGYYKKLVQWSRGEYSDANNQQDDVAVMQEHGIPLKSDDHGNNQSGATVFNLSSSGSVNVSGVIDHQSDIDFFKFKSGDGNLSISANPNDFSPNLDIEINLYDSHGSIINSSNPENSLSASIDEFPLSAGEYFVMIDGVGKGDPLNTGYTDYGSVGQYTISVNDEPPQDDDSFFFPIITPEGKVIMIEL
jgi:hypothetical protein